MERVVTDLFLPAQLPVLHRAKDWQIYLIKDMRLLTQVHTMSDIGVEPADRICSFASRVGFEALKDCDAPETNLSS
jgi:hypothetical protein